MDREELVNEISFDVQTSSDGGEHGLPISTVSGLFNSTTYTQYYSSGEITHFHFHYVRIKSKLGGGERLLLVDEFSITDATAGCTGVLSKIPSVLLFVLFDSAGV